MKTIRKKFLLFLAITTGGIIGLFRGEEAREKYVFKIRTKYENRRLMAEKKSQARKGGVLLDDIEMASYHNN
jgi:hypothetical protein